MCTIKGTLIYTKYLLERVFLVNLLETCRCICPPEFSNAPGVPIGPPRGASATTPPGSAPSHAPSASGARDWLLQDANSNAGG